MLQTHSAALPQWGELNESKHYSIPSSSISSICPNPEHSIQINDHNGTSSQSPPVPQSVQTRNQQEYQVKTVRRIMWIRKC